MAYTFGIVCSKDAACHALPRAEFWSSFRVLVSAIAKPLWKRVKKCLFNANSLCRWAVRIKYESHMSWFFRSHVSLLPDPRCCLQISLNGFDCFFALSADAPPAWDDLFWYGSLCYTFMRKHWSVPSVLGAFCQYEFLCSAESLGPSSRLGWSLAYHLNDKGVYALSNF